MTTGLESSAGMDAAELVRLMRQMNHDLRNPLNATLATANMLSEGIYDPLTPGQERATQRIERNSKRVLALLDDLFGYIKAEIGEYPLVSDDFDPFLLLNKIRIECESLAEAKNLSLILTTTDAVPSTLRGDQAVIRRIILALVWNAISFTAQGKVEIISGWDDGWVVTVSDTGIGIPASAIPRLFETFWRGETGGTWVPTSGSGLGLASARSYARLMKAALSLRESSREGTSFAFRFPATGAS
jgi:signal transduction histidine kinase